MEYETLEQDRCVTTVLINDKEVEIWDIELRPYVLDEDIPFYPDWDTHQDFITEYISHSRDKLIELYIEANYG